jgi:hypothetical protein
MNRKWKQDIGIFCQREPNTHISKAPFFNGMFEEFIRGSNDAEDVSH